jgi:hypothetical protein
VERGRAAVSSVRPAQRDAGALALPADGLGVRARIRRFAYTHQDALWVVAAAAVIMTTVAVVLIAA